MQGLKPIIKAVLDKEELADCGLSELQSLAKQYPYFAPVHLLLAEKIRSLDENLYKEQLEKVSLYVQKPLWLHYLLNEGSFSIDPEISKPQHIPGFRVDEPREPGKIEPENFAEQQPSMETASEANITEPLMPAPVPENEQELAETEPGNIASTESEIPVKIESGIPGEQQTFLEGEPAANITESIIPDTVPENEQEFAETEFGDTTSPGNVEMEDEAKTHYKVPEHEDAAGNEGTGEGDEPLFNIPSLKIEPLKETKNDLLFEPYHTVDYFASQGIKHSGEEIPKDKFGVQLKSFTDWLKIMKKLPVSELEQQMDQGSESKVLSLANHSISQNEIVTETMAEVWLKQGDVTKAREIYQKLSLQNPSKSHYFAAKIESLKTN